MSKRDINKKKRPLKKILIGLLALILVVAIGAGAFWFSWPKEQRNMVLWMVTPGQSYDGYVEYQTIDRNESPMMPTTYKPSVAETTEDDYNVNLSVVTEMVQNEDSKMMKKATVQTNTTDDYYGWQIVADEGFDEDKDTFGPSPLSYLTSGAAANLHTQIDRAAEVMDVELDDVKVEVLNKFHWDGMLTPEGAGFLDETYTNIIIESDESEETIQSLIDVAINSWTAGEAFANETVIEPQLIVNGDNWDNYRATPGTTTTSESYVDGQKISYIMDAPVQSEYIPQLQEEMGASGVDFDAISNLTFEILAISESAENPDRPDLKKITVSFNTNASETWEIYSDEIDGTDGPTSLEYLTAGTALCLTSQLTLTSAQLGLDEIEFRVEQQIDYREENVNSTDMASFADTVHTNVVVESDASEEELNEYYNKSLALCFAGEAFKGATDMHTNAYLNGNEIK